MAESLKPRWQALSNTIFQKLSSLSLVFWRHEALGTECYHGACDLPQFSFCSVLLGKYFSYFVFELKSDVKGPDWS